MNVIDGMVDFHVHSAPSLAPRHSHDPHTLEEARAAGVAKFVLKAHEGSSAERAALLGDEVVGGIVLNSPVGGANPDAVAVAAALGARVVWLPTISSPAHIAASSSPELSAHSGASRSARCRWWRTARCAPSGWTCSTRPPGQAWCCCLGPPHHGRGGGGPGHCPAPGSRPAPW